MAIEIGDDAAVTRRFSRGDVETYVRLGGAAPDGANVPEPMIAALFSYLLGVELPGAGTNYLKQSLYFHRHAEIDSALTARVAVTRLRPEKAIADLKTVCVDEAGREICTGRALVRVKDVGQNGR